jgi:hypothetical protein
MSERSLFDGSASDLRAVGAVAIPEGHAPSFDEELSVSPGDRGVVDLETVSRLPAEGHTRTL